ncbi:hypothetical protein O6H91_15G019200 [Diphasiastrum complanatum]|uniref:Uncharacterized protein n=1 Tax=Diphasiastrum complanatum TaxID=34168 RepID=A0ACC2BGB0_DIPCM|nr:hypothetical protein O6H91_15G019200 [Diphasiastrum complanatum]
MFCMVRGLQIYAKQAIQATKYIGQSFMVTLDHMDHLPITIQYPYRKLASLERFRGRIHFEFQKCIACEVCIHVCPITLPVVDWKFETNIRKKQLKSYSIDFEVYIFCRNCIEYCTTNGLSTTEKYELSTHEHNGLNHDQIGLGCFSTPLIEDSTVRAISRLTQLSREILDGYYD